MILGTKSRRPCGRVWSIVEVIGSSGQVEGQNDLKFDSGGEGESGSCNVGVAEASSFFV